MDCMSAIRDGGKDLLSDADSLCYYTGNDRDVKSFFAYLPPNRGRLGGEVMDMDIDRLSDRDYRAYVAARAGPSPMAKDLCWAFLVGGLICAAGQALLDGYRALGLDERLAGTAVSVTLIAAAALLTGVGVFDRIAKRAGAGTLVPITGFANAVVSPAMEFRQEGLVTGTAAKLFTVAGPVLVYGISASVLYGLLLYIARLF